MSSPNDQPSKSGEHLISKMFHRKSDAAVNVHSDSASVSSKTPLVPEAHEHLKTTSQEEQTAFNELMEKAKTMSPEDFKKYLEQHKEEVETMYRKQGGGIGGGEWIWGDPKILGPW